nr:hypothetical protein [Tanacetum cinerariifolium]
MVVRTRPTLSPGMLARIAKATALSLSSLRKRYRSSYKTPSPSSSLTLPIQRCTRDDCPSLEEAEEAVPEGQQQVVSVVDTTVDEPLGLGYEALRRHVLVLGEGLVPSTFERLDALPPTLFKGYDMDLRVLYTSAIWRPILALESYAGQTDAQRLALWHAIYAIQRGNHDLRRQIAEERHK